MSTTPNSAIRSQTGRRVSAVLTAAKISFADNSNAVKLCDVGSNGLSWLIKLSAAARATVSAFNLMLFWSPDNGATMYYITKFPCLAVTTAPGAENDFGITQTAGVRELGPASSSFWVASDTALTAGIVVNAEIEDA